MVEWNNPMDSQITEAIALSASMMAFLILFVSRIILFLYRQRHNKCTDLYLYAQAGSTTIYPPTPIPEGNSLMKGGVVV